MAEWQPWSSEGKRYAELPVERGTLVDVKYRDGGIGRRLPAGEDTDAQYRDAENRFWRQEGHHSDIMFWRPSPPPSDTGDAE